MQYKRERQVLRDAAVPLQLRVHESSVLEPKVWPVRNDGKALSKPREGFWTSTFDLEYASGWVRYCVAYRYNDPFELHWIVLGVATSARVAVIDSAADLTRLINRYPRMLRGRRGLDFERLSSDYDAVHLTHRGYLTTRGRRPGPALIGWDCESALWFRWAFTERHHVQPYLKDADRIYDMWLSISGWSAKDNQCHPMPPHKASAIVYRRMLDEGHHREDNSA